MTTLRDIDYRGYKIEVLEERSQLGLVGAVVSDNRQFVKVDGEDVSSRAMWGGPSPDTWLENAKVLVDQDIARKEAAEKKAAEKKD